MPHDYPPLWTASCFNINAGNFSIEKWEILPFYWNIEKLGDDEDMYVEYKKSSYKYENAIENYTSRFDGESCSSSEYWRIATNSMVCTFKVYNWGKYSIDNNNPLYIIKWPCLSTAGKVSSSSLIKDWLDYMEEKYGNWIFANDIWKGTSYTFNASIYYIEKFWESWTTIYRDWNTYQFVKKPTTDITEFWEYQLVLSNIEFLQCAADSNSQLKWTQQEGNTCESNFAVTTSYTVQKTPSWNIKGSTETLDKFLRMDGTALSKVSWLLQAITTSEYEPNNQVDKAMDDCIKKYEKLSVNVGGGVKKVPWKNIYFVSTDKTIKDGDYPTPTTFVQTDPTKTITIQWSISKLNIMVLTKWKIVFKDPNNCRNRQVVKWIFYSALPSDGIVRATVTKNTSLSHSQWCNEWWLTIKWVLIWKWLDKMMINSRSNLNNWFNTSDKKGTVMNWASVLIEYSPSVFTKSTMPPGAEDFTTALSIYKQ